MTTNENLKIFVTQTLGCKCPEEVFNHIDVRYDVELPGNNKIHAIINIGNRLLLYLMELNDSAKVKNILPQVVRRGINERNIEGFNRVRIVLITEKYNEIKESADNVFNKIAEIDDSVHLHIVKRQDYPDI